MVYLAAKRGVLLVLTGLELLLGVLLNLLLLGFDIVVQILAARL